MKSALTPKQHRYLLDAARGLSAKRSAALWGVSTNTVQQALNRARAALGAVNIVHAVSLAIAESEITVFEIFSEDVPRELRKSCRTYRRRNRMSAIARRRQV